MIVWRSVHAAIVATYDERLAALAAERDRLKAENAALRDREDRLMHQYVALAQPKPVQPVKPPEPDPVNEAIRRRAAGNAALQQHLNNWARDQRGDGAEAADIVKQIEQWASGASADDAPVLPW